MIWVPDRVSTTNVTNASRNGLLACFGLVWRGRRFGWIPIRFGFYLLQFFGRLDFSHKRVFGRAVEGIGRRYHRILIDEAIGLSHPVQGRPRRRTSIDIKL